MRAISWATGDISDPSLRDRFGVDLSMANTQSQLKDTVLRRGKFVARFAQGTSDLQRAQHLRHHCFVEAAGRAPQPGGLDQDKFDAMCDHILVEDSEGTLLCCFRLMSFASGAQIGASYSAQYYDLERLKTYSAPMLELGRFCVDPSVQDPDVLRLAWGMVAAVVDARGAGMLFGCSSFAGTDNAAYGQAFDLLAEKHLSPAQWRPKVHSDEVVRFADHAGDVVDRRLALAQVPSLLKSYLAMGGWVSDHAVIDRLMNTLHVFTALEIANIPPARAAALRAVAATAPQ